MDEYGDTWMDDTSNERMDEWKDEVDGRKDGWINGQT